MMAMHDPILPDKGRSALEIIPASVHIGAEIRGVDLTQPLPERQVADIRAALLQWKVLFFRDQPLTHAEHVQLARQFGEPTPAHIVFGGDQDYPEVYSIAKYRAANQQAGEPLLRPWSGWHTDVTAAINPPFASILRGVVVPPYGGDTQWTNLAAVYQSLSPALRAFLDGLRAIHRYDVPHATTMSAEYRDRVERSELVSEHPLVRVHPETGERVLYISPDFIDSIVGLKPAESDKLLELLFEQSIRPEYTVRFRWEGGSLAFWDNRSTAHLAPSDIFDVDFDRQLYRVTLVGDVPVGVDGRAATPISGEPIPAAR